MQGRFSNDNWKTKYDEIVFHYLITFILHDCIVFISFVNEILSKYSVILSDEIWQEYNTYIF